MAYWMEGRAATMRCVFVTSPVSLCSGTLKSTLYKHTISVLTQTWDRTLSKKPLSLTIVMRIALISNDALDRDNQKRQETKLERLDKPRRRWSKGVTRERRTA